MQYNDNKIDINDSTITQYNKNKVKVLLFALVLVLFVSIIGTSAAFFLAEVSSSSKSTITATTPAQVAKWSVKVNGEDISASKELTLDYKTENNEFVADGKIAPDSTIYAEVELDLTGTEVAVDILGKVDTQVLASQIGSSKFITKLTLDNNIVLQEEAQDTPTLALDAVPGIHKVKITITWDNSDDQNSDSDTLLGKSKNLIISLPTTLTIQQHINAT